MKKIIFVLTFILALTTCAFASDVAVQINGEIVNFKDEQGNIVNAQIINSRTMVPMRKIFEILGAEIEWDGANRIVTGTKDDVKIKLQIDNNVATKTKNGEVEEILLDTAPTIVNDRTMVPLRFIAESLNKQVGWDNKNRTAIIIDYDYFPNDLKSRASALYNFLNTKSNSIEYSITHNYYDLKNANNNSSFKTKVNAVIENNVQTINLNLSGTNELSKEITSEGWNNTSFKLTYEEDKVLINSDNEKIRVMFEINENSVLKTYDELNLSGMPFGSFGEMFEIWAGVKDDELSVNTFSELKNDYTKLCNLFSTSNIANNKLSSTSTKINYDAYKIEYFDLAKLDNFVSNNDFLNAINLVNKLFFKNDVLKDVVLYDSSEILINFSVDNNVFKATVNMVNEYNEKNEYVIELKHS